MYLSHLLIDTGSNPDRPRPGRQWLRNIYRVHQRLSMAFPSRPQLEEDPHFLRPFDPQAFERARFLFRIDNTIETKTPSLFSVGSTIEPKAPRAVIVVQSDLKPNWDYAFSNARMFLAAPPQIQQWQPAFSPGEKLRFRIRMNLSKKRSQKRMPTEQVDALDRPKPQGKRVALTWESDQKPEEVIIPWFARKCTQKGFELRSCKVLHMGFAAGYLPGKKTKPGEPEFANDDSRLKFLSGVLEGIIVVSDPAIFFQTLTVGIGSAKAFGFGLLSVAPA